MNSILYDYLIVGQGVAGSVLAMTLAEEGRSLFVIDSPNPNTSSAIAAGIMNPITGKRMTVSWNADLFFPEAISFYNKMEGELKSSFLSEHSVVRIFSSVAEQNDWSAKWDNEKYQNFIKKDLNESSDNPSIPFPYGSLDVTGGGRLDTPGFLASVKNQLQKKGCYKSQNIRLSDINIEEGHLRVGDILAKRIVFCTGFDLDNWGFLPFTPMKGEVLELESKDFRSTKTLVGGCFLSPISENRYYAGATYDWKNINLEKTNAAKEDILHKVSRFTSASFEVKKHKVGIRPAVKDRRPLLGKHPSMNDVYLFSGLGSKGVSMAPYLAKRLLQFIETGIPLDDDMDLNRFVK